MPPLVDDALAHGDVAGEIGQILAVLVVVVLFLGNPRTGGPSLSRVWRDSCFVSKGVSIKRL
jgi:hypothetical protein